MSTFYKNFEIRPAPYPPSEGNEWQVRVYIVNRSSGDRIPFTSSTAFKTKEEAIKHSTTFAQEIIDGKHDNLSIEEIS